MPIDVGTQAPDFTLKTQDEKDWKLSAHKGKTVVLGLVTTKFGEMESKATLKRRIAEYKTPEPEHNTEAYDAITENCCQH